MKNTLFILLSLGLITILINGCKKEAEIDNPFDKVDYGNKNQFTDTLNQASFAWLQRNVLSLKCATPGCHDSHFEPDFRTPQSSYNTLVWAPIIKNNASQSFEYRVIPFEPSKSVLYERITNCCFVNQNDRMPQDNIGVPLENNLVQAVFNWIKNGARDMNGNVMEKPNLPPNIIGYLATSSNFQVNYSENRIGNEFYNPFIAPDNVAMYVGFLVEDDETAVENLKVNQLRISTDMDNFSNALTYNAVFFNVPGTGKFWIANVATGALPKNTTMYMRYYVSDGQNPTVEYPHNNLIEPFKGFWSFQVHP
jgi:hypothetical protein